MNLNLSHKSSVVQAGMLALAGLALTANPLKAVTTAPGDLIFAVRSNLAADQNVYLFDLGAALPSTGIVASNLGADLSAVFGSDWATNTNLRWSVSGYDSSGNVDVSKAETTYGVQSTKNGGYTGQNGATLNTIEGKMDNVLTEFKAGSDSGVSGFPSGGYSSHGGASVLKTDVNGYNTYGPSGYTSFGASMEATGFTNSAVDIYSIAGSTSSTYVGTFTVNPTTGSISFATSPPSAVPEPGHAALLGLGLLGMLYRRRRTPQSA